ncbi:unnamed protein product [Spirodela intermedia]|uniref:Thioredoxin domain-containing protein n=1 Tax=Spirodela intermedia TaxID=51605 RepID=A0A7I8IXQ9_SPIIN|nr:unnamed protein product [Spirodela intermedia]CAA6662754.1 unnamed protein product [Spirodela intermedia]
MAEEGTVISVRTVDQWNELFEQAKASKKLVVVDFTASWCGPCRIITPILMELARRTPLVTFLKVDVDDLKYEPTDGGGGVGIEAMPTFLFLREGQLVDKMIGARRRNCSRRSRSTSRSCEVSSVQRRVRLSFSGAVLLTRYCK